MDTSYIQETDLMNKDNTYIVDLETQMGNRSAKFPLRASEILCVSYTKLNSGEIHTASGTEIGEALDFLLEEDKVLVFHNTQFDATVINRLTGRQVRNKLICTKTWGFLLFKDNEWSDMDVHGIVPNIDLVPTDLVGSTSLLAWGLRLNIIKDEAEITQGIDWSTSTFTKEMGEYCEQDVRITEAVFNFLKTNTTKESVHHDAYGRPQSVIKSLTGWFQDRDKQNWGYQNERDVNDYELMEKYGMEPIDHSDDFE